LSGKSTARERRREYPVQSRDYYRVDRLSGLWCRRHGDPGPRRHVRSRSCDGRACGACGGDQLGKQERQIDGRRRRAGYGRTGADRSETLRQAYAAAPPAGIEGLKIDDSSTPQVPLKTKTVAKPPVQKSYALLSEAQIAGIKERLRLSPSQEYYWPAVENALRAVARKIHATRHADPNGTGAPIIDPEAEEVQQLKSAAMPLLFQLRDDQKREVRTLARLIGLDKVAAAI
jgi:hypothetical protein